MVEMMEEARQLVAKVEEVERRVYSLNYRIKEYEHKIAEVQNRIPFVEGDREVEVFHRLLDGNSMHAIGKQMRLSSTTIFRVRNKILSQMMKEPRSYFFLITYVQHSGQIVEERKTYISIYNVTEF